MPASSRRRRPQQPLRPSPWRPARFLEVHRGIDRTCLLPAASFLSVLGPEATEPNALIYLAYLGAVLLTVGLLTLGVGLVRGHGGVKWGGIRERA